MADTGDRDRAPGMVASPETDTLAVRVEALQTENDGLRRHLAAEQRLRHDAEMIIDERQDEICELDDVIKTLQDELAALRGELAALRGDQAGPPLQDEPLQDEQPQVEPPQAEQPLPWPLPPPSVAGSEGSLPPPPLPVGAWPWPVERPLLLSSPPPSVAGSEGSLPPPLPSVFGSESSRDTAPAARNPTDVTLADASRQELQAAMDAIQTPTTFFLTPTPLADARREREAARNRHQDRHLELDAIQRRTTMLTPPPMAGARGDGDAALMRHQDRHLEVLLQGPTEFRGGEMHTKDETPSAGASPVAAGEHSLPPTSGDGAGGALPDATRPGQRRNKHLERYLAEKREEHARQIAADAFQAALESVEEGVVDPAVAAAASAEPPPPPPTSIPPLSGPHPHTQYPHMDLFYLARARNAGLADDAGSGSYTGANTDPSRPNSDDGGGGGGASGRPAPPKAKLLRAGAASRLERILGWR